MTQLKPMLSSGSEPSFGEMVTFLLMSLKTSKAGYTKVPNALL